ncbi:5'-methylthioadenosine/adenosylhomocysteine nucleosidase [uncultured Cardiobacterium sp.]|uniref:5'-methylthioadenosine/adenosylhomocysteine nucleosidase n=1 Tax=uncultured Cardiobacterium sp. TaxID=417619 RepID=UPI002639B17C|nr:5'-methylthioadenosine/adenosylhomocysteine nucleosidase [uncultured Cardiobacterium sp.]
MTRKTAPVAIIGAMEQEVALLHSRISQAHQEKVAHIAITRGLLAGKPVLLAQSGIGKVNAAITTTVLLEKFGAGCVINTGSAGGLQGGMKQGDVVVGIQTAHHDADATAFGYAIGQLPQMPARYEADAGLIEHAARAAIAFDGAAIHRGLIVSGDQFINHPDKIARIRAHFPDALAVEMEAAAIAQTCYQFARPCVIIRALSDLADGEAEYSFETFLQMAATHSAEMVENLVKAL